MRPKHVGFIVMLGISQSSCRNVELDYVCHTSRLNRNSPGEGLPQQSLYLHADGCLLFSEMWKVVAWHLPLRSIDFDDHGYDRDQTDVHKISINVLQRLLEPW